MVSLERESAALPAASAQILLWRRGIEKPRGPQLPGFFVNRRVRCFRTRLEWLPDQDSKVVGQLVSSVVRALSGCLKALCVWYLREFKCWFVLCPDGLDVAN